MSGLVTTLMMAFSLMIWVLVLVNRMADDRDAFVALHCEAALDPPACEVETLAKLRHYRGR